MDLGGVLAAAWMILRPCGCATCRPPSQTPNCVVPGAPPLWVSFSSSVCRGFAEGVFVGKFVFIYLRFPLSLGFVCLRGFQDLVLRLCLSLSFFMSKFVFIYLGVSFWFPLSIGFVCLCGFMNLVL